jgi:hypothetical protein
MVHSDFLARCELGCRVVARDGVRYSHKALARSGVHVTFNRCLDNNERSVLAHFKFCFLYDGLELGFFSHHRIGSDHQRGQKTKRKLPYLGMITLSITCITPLSATMSVADTLAPSTITPPIVETVNSEPWTVFTLPALTSAAITLPGTTW